MFSLFACIFSSPKVWNRHFFVLFKNRLFWTGETKTDEDDEQDQDPSWDGPLSSEVCLTVPSSFHVLRWDEWISQMSWSSVGNILQ